VLDGGLQKAFKPKGYFLRDCCPDKRTEALDGDFYSTIEKIERMERK